jgi:hypothetical protein
MKDTDPDRRGELTDAQLDQLLAETNRELLEHVEATSDPSRTLNAIMARNAEQDRNDGRARPGRGIRRAAHGLGEALDSLAEIIGGRLDVRASAFVTSDSFAIRALTALAIAGALASAVVVWLVDGPDVPWPIVLSAAGMWGGAIAAMATIRYSFAYRARRGRDPGQALAAIMRSRAGIRAIARVLADRGNRGDGAMRVDRSALTKARELARELARDRGLARLDGLWRLRSAGAPTEAGLLLRDIIASLDMGILLARQQGRILARVDRLTNTRRRDAALADAANLDRELRECLIRTRSWLLDLARTLDEQQVDVSGADLSRMDINPELLNGAIWTDQTSWPPRVASQVRAHSAEIRAGVYQVRLGNTLDRDLALS